MRAAALFALRMILFLLCRALTAEEDVNRISEEDDARLRIKRRKKLIFHKK